MQRSVKRSAVRVRWEFSDTPYKNYDELPLFLNAATVAKVLGIAPSSSYELMHEKDFHRRSAIGSSC